MTMVDHLGGSLVYECRFKQQAAVFSKRALINPLLTHYFPQGLVESEYFTGGNKHDSK